MKQLIFTSAKVYTRYRKQISLLLLLIFITSCNGQNKGRSPKDSTGTIPVRPPEIHAAAFGGGGKAKTAPEITYAYSGRFTASVTKEKLKNIRSVGEITPELWRRLLLSPKERVEFDRRKNTDYSQIYYFFFPEERNYDYNKLVDYVFVEISAICNGKTLTSQSAGGTLTADQKNILRTADLDTDLRIKIQFRYKDQAGDPSDSKIIEGEAAVTVVPETEAEYPGGYKQLTAYLIENVFDKVSGTRSAERIQQAIVKFTVNEEGRVVNARMSSTSADPKTDKLLLDVINNMPKWKPAENAQGIKVKQEFSIPFGIGC